MEFRVETKLAEHLREKGFRATPGRVALLELLEKAKKPISVDEATRALRGRMDAANVYRALEAFTGSGLIRRADVGHRHMHYELAAPPKHHHHYVCVDCGARTLHA